MSKKKNISEIKILVYKDDNNVVKDKTIILLSKNEYGIEVQIYNNIEKIKYGNSFFLPWHRVLKIKNLDNTNDKN